MRLSSLNRIFVVLGAYENDIREAINGFDVEVIQNPKWECGKSTSIQCGINFIKKQEYDAVVICLVDQVHLTSVMIDSLINRFLKTGCEVVATRIDGCQCNPVLFSAKLFSRFEELRGEEGGQKILSQSKVEWVDWEDKKLIEDIDTIDDFQSLSSSNNPFR